jgi:pantoate--beta-alanine ligase
VRTVTTIAELRAMLRGVRARGDRVGLVPTMGALHAGHLALIDAAREHAQCVVVSVFVNPLQFARGEDLAAYPRNLDRDRSLADERGVDILFAPAVEEMYPAPPVVAVTPVASPDGDLPLDARWEGAVRPGHFAGVLTVVAKLFNCVSPDVAAFGRKDVQQAVLVRAMVRDLNLPVELLVVPTVRDADGLALSSRNAYLSAEERARALAIPRALGAMRTAWVDRGVTDAAALEAVGRASLRDISGVTVDYLGVADPERLAPVATVAVDSVALVAARVGRTRLIDNIDFGPPRGTGRA